MTQTGTVVEYASPARPDDADEIVAWPDKWYRGKRLIFAIGLIVLGGWFGYDGWVAWPAKNQEAIARGGVTKLPHSDLDIKIQKILAVTLPPLGLLWLGRIFYTSRGTYRLRGDTLSVPGHPAIPIDSITQIDLSRWERKGIAVIEYERSRGTGDGATGDGSAVIDYERSGRTARFVLDDFIYQRKPTDDILDRIKARVAPEEAAAATPEA